MIRVLLPGADVHNCKANECCVLCRDDARNVLVAMMAALGDVSKASHSACARLNPACNLTMSRSKLAVLVVNMCLPVFALVSSKTDLYA